MRMVIKLPIMKPRHVNVTLRLHVRTIRQRRHVDERYDISASLTRRNVGGENGVLPRGCDVYQRGYLFIDLIRRSRLLHWSVVLVVILTLIL